MIEKKVIAEYERELANPTKKGDAEQGPPA
jgi:hypothetical protein